MVAEELIEEGIVVGAKKGSAEIILVNSDNCEECSAKLFCKPRGKETHILKAFDPYGVREGDEVRISVQGAKILEASFFLYGLPLIIMIAGLLLGMVLFENTLNKEFYSFLFGGSLTALYYLYYYINSISRKKELLPKIIMVKRRK